MSETIDHPLLDELGKLKIADCAQALIRHGTYWYDTQNQSYFAYNGKHYTQVNEVFFEKRLQFRKLLKKRLSIPAAKIKSLGCIY